MIQLTVEELGENVTLSVVEGDRIDLMIDEESPVVLEVSDAVFVGDLSPETQQRLSELEANTDGLIGGIDFLTHYRLIRDN